MAEQPEELPPPYTEKPPMPSAPTYNPHEPPYQPPAKLQRYPEHVSCPETSKTPYPVQPHPAPPQQQPHPAPLQYPPQQQQQHPAPLQYPPQQQQPHPAPLHYPPQQQQPQPAPLYYPQPPPPPLRPILSTGTPLTTVVQSSSPNGASNTVIVVGGTARAFACPLCRTGTLVKRIDNWGIFWLLIFTALLPVFPFGLIAIIYIICKRLRKVKCGICGYNIYVRFSSCC